MRALVDCLTFPFKVVERNPFAVAMVTLTPFSAASMATGFGLLPANRKECLFLKLFTSRDNCNPFLFTRNDEFVRSNSHARSPDCACKVADILFEYVEKFNA